MGSFPETYNDPCQLTKQIAGVSIKIEVVSALDRVTECINKGPLVSFPSGVGRGGGGGLSAFRPKKI